MPSLTPWSSSHCGCPGQPDSKVCEDSRVWLIFTLPSAPTLQGSKQALASTKQLGKGTVAFATDVNTVLLIQVCDPKRLHARLSDRNARSTRTEALASLLPFGNPMAHSKLVRHTDFRMFLPSEAWCNDVDLVQSWDGAAMHVQLQHHANTSCPVGRFQLLLGSHSGMFPGLECSFAI